MTRFDLHAREGRKWGPKEVIATMVHPVPRRKVLVVDDDADIRYALRLLFEVEGYVVVGTASNGLEGVMMARLHQPDLVVLDLVMPQMDGAEAAVAIREILPDVRIVAFSAVLDDRPQWADAHLNKDRVSEVAPLISRMFETGLHRSPA